MKNKPQLIRISFYLNVLGTCVRTNISDTINVYTNQTSLFNFIFKQRKIFMVDRYNIHRLIYLTNLALAYVVFYKNN